MGDSRLSFIEVKLDKIEQSSRQLQNEVETLKQDVTIIDENALALEKGFRWMEEDFVEVNKDLDIIKSFAENTDIFYGKIFYEWEGFSSW